MTAFLDHMATGTTEVCRCWRLTRTDGVVMGFTDHDRDLAFDGTLYRADTGLAARAVAQGTGLSVDNTEALGILSTSAIREDEIEAGRYDGAEIEAWLVRWSDTDARMLRFRGTIGEVSRGGGAFTAELRGLTDLLNQPMGRIYQPLCQANLGDGDCGVDFDLDGLSETLSAREVEEGRVFVLDGLHLYDDRWFERGRLMPQDGPAAGLSGTIKTDRLMADGSRRIELWEPIRAEVTGATTLRLVPGCDKRLATCRDKFLNVINFRGFPTIPGDDWLVAVPREQGA